MTRTYAIVHRKKHDLVRFNVSVFLRVSLLSLNTACVLKEQLSQELKKFMYNNISLPTMLMNCQMRHTKCKDQIYFYFFTF